MIISGKFDLHNNSNLGMNVFMKNITVHGILVDSLFNPLNDDWFVTYDLMKQGIENGSVQPLPATVFPPDRIEEAFRWDLLIK